MRYAKAAVAQKIQKGFFMKKVTRSITVDVSRKSCARVVFATQNDLNSRCLLITLTDDGKPYAVSKSLTATVNFKCADESQWSYLATVLDDGKLEYTISPNVLAVEGKTQATISLFDESGNKLTSSPFVIEVVSTLYPENELSDEAKLSYVDEMIGRFTGFQSQENERQENEGLREENEAKRQEYYEDLDTCLDLLEELQEKMIEAGANGSMILTTALDVYPVGSIYMSLDAKSPADLFGGAWERLKDRFLLGAGDTYTAGSVGGSATHTIRETKHLPGGAMAVVQNLTGGIVTGIGGTKWSSSSYNDKEFIITTRRIGAELDNSQCEQPINHMPPYLAVYMWKRVA